MDQFRLETTFEFIVNLCPKCRTKFGCRGEPSVPGIFKFIAKVHETGFIFDAPRPDYACKFININSSSLARIEHFTHQFMSNIAK